MLLRHQSFPASLFHKKHSNPSTIINPPLIFFETQQRCQTPKKFRRLVRKGLQTKNPPTLAVWGQHVSKKKKNSLAMASVTSACTSRIFKGVFCQLQKTVGFTSYVPSLLAGFGCLVLDGKLCRQSSTWRLRKEPTMSPRLTCQTRILKSTAFRFSIAIFSKFVSLNGPAFRVTNACRNSNFSLYPTIAQ